MRAAACKNELDIDADSFIYGDCPQDTHQEEDDDNGSLFDKKHHRVKLSDDDEDDDENLEGSGDDGYSTGNEDEEDDNDNDQDEESMTNRVHGKKKISNTHNKKEDDLHKSMEIELCHHLQCPIGSLCRVRLRKSSQSAEVSSAVSQVSRQYQNSKHEAFCDCDEMCSRISDLDLETPGWTKGEVCGSNGLLYTSECQLRQESCQRNQVISLTSRTNCNGTYAHQVLREVKTNKHDSSTPAVTSLHWSLHGQSRKKTTVVDEGDQGIKRAKGKHNNKTPLNKNRNDMNKGITNHKDKTHHHDDDHHHSENEAKNRNHTHSGDDGKKRFCFFFSICP